MSRQLQVRRFGWLICTLAVMLGTERFAAVASAQLHEWRGDKSARSSPTYEDFGTAGNWSTGTVPGATNIARFDDHDTLGANDVHAVVLDTDRTVADLQVITGDDVLFDLDGNTFTANLIQVDSTAITDAKLEFHNLDTVNAATLDVGGDIQLEGAVGMSTLILRGDTGAGSFGQLDADLDAKLIIAEDSNLVGPDALFQILEGATLSMTLTTTDTLIGVGKTTSIATGTNKGTLEINGEGSSASLNDIDVGGTDVNNNITNEGHIKVLAGGELNAANVVVAGDSGNGNSSVLVDGSDSGGTASTMDLSGDLTIGDLTKAVMDVTNGGFATAVNVNVGVGSGATGSMIQVDDADSALDVDTKLTVGQTGRLEVFDGRTNVGSNASTSGTLDEPRVWVAQGGTLEIHPSGSAYVGNSAGETTESGTLRVGRDGFLMGAGVIKGDVKVDGDANGDATFSPEGDSGESVAVFEIEANSTSDGDYTQGEFGILRSDPSRSTTSPNPMLLERVNVEGVATLDGFLQFVDAGDAPTLDLFDDDHPEWVDIDTDPTLTPILLQADGGLSGEFATIGDDMGNEQVVVDGDPLSSTFDFALAVYYTDELAVSGEDTVRVRFSLSADGNFDGSVGGPDYTIWANNFGMGTRFREGDYNGDGAVTGPDYTLWANNFGANESSFGPESVPEPSSLLLAALGLAGMLVIRRRARLRVC